MKKGFMLTLRDLSPLTEAGMTDWLPVLVLLGILVLMWRSDWIIGLFKKRPNREMGEQRNNLDLFGPVDTSKTRNLFDDL